MRRLLTPAPGRRRVQAGPRAARGPPCLSAEVRATPHRSLYCFTVLFRNPPPPRARALLTGLGCGLLARLLPHVLHGRAHFWVLREGQGGRPGLGLGLSAGADPEGLADQLEALAGVRATFYLRGELTRTHPHLAQRIAEAGHELGLSGTAGRRSDAASLRRDREELERLGGRPVSLWRLERPITPWTLPTLRRAGLRAVWRGLEGPPAVLLDGAEPGGLLSLDGVSLAELPDLLATLRVRGYRPLPVGELDGLRSETLRGLLQRLWRAGVDDRFDRAHRVLKLTARARGLFRISRRPYPFPGHPPALPGGPPFPPGTPAAELHIHSKRLVALAELSALTAYRAFGESLRDVAAALQGREDYREVKLVWALTLFHEVLPPLGFGLQALENPRQARVTAFFMNLLRLLYGAKNSGGRGIVPQLAWISRGALLERYGGASTPDESAILPRRGTGEA